ncbi:NUDIX hydrolase domain-like protein [Xylaria scruposa]|nr:NUDIX hydrolase domain-like protein [Xylaria scruposa]
MSLTKFRPTLLVLPPRNLIPTKIPLCHLQAAASVTGFTNLRNPVFYEIKRHISYQSHRDRFWRVESASSKHLTKSHPSRSLEQTRRLHPNSKYTRTEVSDISRILQRHRLRYQNKVSPTSTSGHASTMEKNMSYLDVMRLADTFPYEDKEPEAYHELSMTLYKLVWKDNNGPVLGYMLASTVNRLLAVPESLRGPVVVDESAQTVRAFEQATEPERSAAVAAVMQYWRENETFDTLRGWRDELWPVYGTDTEVLYSAERSGVGLLGAMRYGVHMMGYVRDETAPYGMRFWVPRRAHDKPTYPGMLDNTVAGGLMTGEDPFECMVREADEEASLSEKLMRERAKFTGMVTYIYITDERAGGEAGQIYPETQWVYDIELPKDERPTPKDGEVAEFYLWTVDEVREGLAKDQFKPNCALVIINFFIRHGIITAANEPDYAEILQRMHRKLPFPGPHQAYAASLEAPAAALADAAATLAS